MDQTMPDNDLLKTLTDHKKESMDSAEKTFQSPSKSKDWDENQFSKTEKAPFQSD